MSELLTCNPNRWDIIHVKHLRGAQIWAEELNLEQVGVDNIFSNLGGDSLLAAVLFSKVIETYKIETSLIEFFKRTTIAEQALFIDKLKKVKTGSETTQDEETIKEKLRLLGDNKYRS